MSTRRASLVNLRDVPPIPFIIYPENNTYRMFQYFLVVLSIYTCSVSIFLWTFIAPLPTYAIIIDTVINGFFLVDMILSFFVAYVDKKTLAVVDNKKKIVQKALKMVFQRIILMIPFELFGIHSDPSSLTYQILTFCCFVRLFRAIRVHPLFSELEMNGRFNYTWVRLAKMILVCLFVCHYGGCVFYFIATLNGDPKGTWFELADSNFLKLSLIVQYLTSIYWAVTSFTTVGFGDLHAVTILEKLFSIYFLFQNIVVVACVTTKMTQLLAPDVGSTGRYRARRHRVFSFCRQHNLPTHLREEVSTHLELEFLSKLQPSEEHGIFNSLPMPIRGMILNYLYNNYVTNNYLFARVSNAIQLQLVQVMEPVYFLANSTVILQDEVPTCFYFVVRGSVEFKSLRDGIGRDAGTAIAGDVFGQSCVLCNKPQIFTVKTKEVCQLLKLDRETLFDILKDNATDRSHIMDNEITRLRENNDPYMVTVLNEIVRTAAAHEA